MPQTLTPIAELSDLGVGVADLIGSFVAASDTTVRFRNTGDLVLFVNNGSASPLAATMEGVDEADDDDLTIAAGDVGAFFRIPPDKFNVNGQAELTLDATSSITLGLYRLRRR